MGNVGDRFELLARAAAGGMGSVWRARDRMTNATVAVKILALDRPFDLVRFEREALLLAALDHPNVVRYIAHGVTPDKVHYLVQEWVDGITLSTQLNTLGVTAREAVQIGIGIADALGAAHECGIIHRDVKPANVILDGGDVRRVKLVDFGIARLASDAGVLTRTGVLIGTPSYMAPEQARGSVVITPPADVWSLGCVMYEALTGRKAFAGRTSEAVRAKVLLAPPESVAATCAEAPFALVDLVHAMLAKGQTERPFSGNRAAVMLRALPPIPDGPRRRVGGPEQSTAVMPVRAANRTNAESSGAANCFVYFTAAPAFEEQPAPPVEQVKRISDKYDLEMHELEDGSVILVSNEQGQHGAIAATRAALALKQEVFDGAVSVFAQGVDETIAEAIDRGADAQAQAAMENLFADVIQKESSIHVDEVIAELVCEEISIDRTDAGPVVSARRLGTG
ncbi:MAG: serine/threonine protein kinase [Deltaproteobacteria bacterium]|nr:serine/threonine protein kinase [Deltaproteobacteria bacterium]